jgi:peptide/nickel transport system ATP-binding protein
MKFLEVENLTISFGNKVVVNSVSFDLAAGERLGVIGESGSGKTMIALAVIGLLPDTATATGSIRLAGEELLRLSDQQMSAYRGKQLAMVFQEPLTALNPLMRVGKQIAQPLLNHDKVSRKAGITRAIELCASVGLPDPQHIVRAYPHQLSGGQRQRIGLAIAIACNPKLLIVD